MRRLWRASIWHPDAIPPDEWKYRSLKRVWLPIFDALVIAAGLWLVLWSTPVLDGLFPHWLVDVSGYTLSTVAVVCLAGISFPALWAVEILGKAVLVSLLAAYAAALWTTAVQGGGASAFVATIASVALLVPMIRLSILGEEIKERRDENEAA